MQSGHRREKAFWAAATLTGTVLTAVLEQTRGTQTDRPLQAPSILSVIIQVLFYNVLRSIEPSRD